MESNNSWKVLSLEFLCEQTPEIKKAFNNYIAKNNKFPFGESIYNDDNSELVICIQAWWDSLNKEEQYDALLNYYNQLQIRADGVSMELEYYS